MRIQTSTDILEAGRGRGICTFSLCYALFSFLRRHVISLEKLNAALRLCVRYVIISGG